MFPRLWPPLLALALAASTAGAEESKPAGDSKPPAEKPAGGSGGDASSKGGSGSSAAGDAEKPPSATGGYSWTEKPRHGSRRRKHKAGDPVAKFPTFRMRADGTSEITVFVTRKVNVEVRKVAGRVAFVLDGADVPVSNNTNALVTTHFDTPASRARLLPSKEGTQLIVELREAAEVSHRVADGPRGSITLIVTLPASKRSYSKLDDDADDARENRDRPAKSGEARGQHRRGPNP